MERLDPAYYRRLNNVTVKDAFPLPRTKDCLDATAGAKYFSSYYQVPVNPPDIPKTAFTTKFGLFEFTTMPMGLTSAGATIKRVMELVPQGLQWKTCLIFLDDVITFGATFDEHLTRLKGVLARISQANVKLKTEK